MSDRAKTAKTYSLRGQLITLIVALAIPLVALQGWWSYHGYRDARAHAETAALAFADAASLGVMQFFPASLTNARIAAERTVTAELANSVLGQIRASSAEALFQGKTPLNLLSSAGRVYNIYGQFTNIVRTGGLYEGFTTTIQRLNGGAGEFLQKVTFTVTFADGRQETYVTYVARQ